MHTFRLFTLKGVVILLAIITAGAGYAPTTSYNRASPDTSLLQPNASQFIIQADNIELVREAIRSVGGQFTHDLPVINGVGAMLTPDQYATLATDDTLLLTANQAVRVNTSNASVRDNFDSASWDNNNGSELWAGYWLEEGDDFLPMRGEIAIVDGVAGLGGSNKALSREIDLSFTTGATLTFDYRFKGLQQNYEAALLEISSDGGKSWSTLDRFDKINSGSGWSITSYDLAEYTSGLNVIRFSTLAGVRHNAKFEFDNLEITYRNIPTETLRDEFGTIAYDNNDGSATWSSNWMEMNDNGGAVSGSIKIKPTHNLFMKKGNRALSRAAYLPNGSIAVLSFTYHRVYFTRPEQYVAVEISKDGGGSWTELDRFAGPDTDIVPELVSYNISSFVSPDTIIRFVTSATMGDWNNFYIDDVQIEYSSNVVSSHVVETVSDYFVEQAYDGSNGSQPWLTDWGEENDDGKPDKGGIKVNKKDFLQIGGRNKSIFRSVDISNASKAQLSLMYSVPKFDGPEDYIEIDLSTDQGATWTTLARLAGDQNGVPNITGYYYEDLFDEAEFEGEEEDESNLLSRSIFEMPSNFDLELNDEFEHFYDDDFFVGEINASGFIPVFFDISDFITEDLTIRLRTAPDKSMKGSDRMHLDNIKISMQATPDTHYPELIGADLLHTEGINGSGIGVAVIDTGNWSHDSLNKNPEGDMRLLAQYNAITNQMESPGFENDGSGHGVHVTSMILSSNLSASQRYNGVAPYANLISVKAFDDSGAGTYLDVIRAIDWVVAHKEQHNIRVMNLSFSATPQSYYWDDPLNQAVMRAWQEGIVVVAAAGNTGPDPMTIGVPGNVPYVITVGAMSDNYTPNNIDDDVLASFSSAGPTVEGFVKPEMVAPGGHMLGLMPLNAQIAQAYPQFQQDASYYTMSGTSQASAVTSGVVALMLQADPTLTPDKGEMPPYVNFTHSGRPKQYAGLFGLPTRGRHDQCL